MLFVGIFLFFERTLERKSIDILMLFQIIMVALAGLIVLVTLLGRINKTLANLGIAIFCLLGYGGIGIISGLYSPDAVLSIYKSSIIIIDICLCATILSYQPHKYYVNKFITLTYLFYSFLILSVMTGAIFWPARAFEPWSGMFGFILNGALPIMNPNDVTFMTAIIGLVTVNRLLDKNYKNRSMKLLYLVFLVCVLSVMILSQSRTSIIAFTIAFYYLLILRKRGTFFFVSLFITIALLIGGVAADVVKYMRRGQTDKELSSLTGRVYLWQEGLEKISESPILGYGMASTGFKGVLTKVHAGHLHNAFLEVMLGTGLLGFAFWFTALMLTFLRIFFSIPRTLAADLKNLSIEMKILTLCALIRMFTGQTFVLHNYSFFLFICLITFSISFA